MSIVHSPNQSHLRASRPVAGIDRLAPHLELVTMRLGDAIYDHEVQLQHVYWPTTAIVSLLYGLVSGASAEIAAVGNEGVPGIALFIGGETTPGAGVVQTAGHGYRLHGRMLKAQFKCAGTIRYRCGHQSILERDGLEAHACEC